MVSRRVFALRAVLATVAVAALLILALSFEGPRSVLARGAFSAYLAWHGMYIARGDLRVATDRLTATGLQIDDRHGRVLSIDRLTLDYDWHVLIGRSDRRYGIRALDITHPALRIYVLSDGSTNLSPFAPRAGAPPATVAPNANPLPPLELALRVTDGRLDVENPTAFARPGRAFSVTDVQLAADAHAGRLVGHAFARYAAEGTATVIRGAISEDDTVGFAQAQFVAHGAAVAPPLDAFISTPLFAVERGIADVTIRAYDAGYSSSAGPTWHASARAELTGGQFRVVPLDVPVRDMRGTLTLGGGYLGFASLIGTAARLPVTAAGSIRLVDGVRLAFSARTRGDLRDGKHLLTFARTSALDGGFDGRLRVDGLLHDIHVAGAVAAPGDAHVLGLPVRAAHAAFYYQNNHVTIPQVDAQYDRGHVWADGDVALTTSEPEIQAIVRARMPSAHVPVIVNLNRGGDVATLLSIDGPPSSAEFNVFARTLRGRGAVATAAAGGTFGRSAVGALLVAWPGGDVSARTAYDHSNPADRALFASVIASHAPVELYAGAASLPGIATPISLPRLAGIFDGVALVRGADPPGGDLQTAIDMQGRRVVIGAERIDDVALRAHGNGPRISLDAFTLRGRDATMRASGIAAVNMSTLHAAAELRGSGAIDLANAPSVPGVSLGGSLRGDFEAAMSDSGWAASVATRDGDATLAGVPLRGATLNATAGGHQPLRYALDGGALGGTIAAIGTTASSDIFASGIDMRALRPSGSPLDAGTAVLIGTVATTSSGPDLSAGVSVADGRYGRLPIDASADLVFAGRVLRASGDVDVSGTRVQLRGSARGIAPSASLRDVALDATAAVNDGNLAIVQGYLPPAMPVTGAFDAHMTIAGNANAPQVAGSLASGAATLRGVTLLGNASTFAYRDGGITIRNGSTQHGDTRLAFGGSYSPREASVHAASTHIDLSDINDFFEGRDVLEGIGPATLSLALAPNSVNARGHIVLSDAQVAGIPLGQVDLSLRGVGTDALHLDLAQQGELGASTLAGDITFHVHAAAIPDVQSATYRFGARATNIDLGLVARLTGLEDVGMRGLMDADGSVGGSFRRPSVDVAFAVREGYVNKVPVRTARARLVSDGTRVSLRDAYVEVPFGNASANGSFAPSGAIAGDAQISITDLSGLAALAGRSGDVSGSAQAQLQVAGTVRLPVLHGTVNAAPGTLFGVAYDQLAARATYSKNELTIGDTELRLAHGRGSVTLAGTLPLELVPFALGPPRRPIDLRVQATHVDMAAFDPLLKQFGTVGGMLDGNASMSGTAGSPRVAGSAHLRQGSVVSPRYQTVPLEAISADLALSQDAITLSNLAGKAGKGTFGGSGAAYIVPAVGLRHTPGLAYYATLHANNFPLAMPNWISGTVNGDLGLSKSGSTPLFYGDVALRDGAIPLSAIVQMATMLGDTSGPPPTTNIPGVPAVLPGHMIAYGGGVYPPGSHLLTPAALQTPAPTIFDLPSVNLQVTAKANNVRVRGGAVDLTTDGAVAIDGSVRDPQLAGEFLAKRGTIGAYGVTFRVERGVLSFSPDQGVLPSLDARASTTIGGDRITMDVTGRIDRLNTVLSSSQGQTPEGIVATILTGSDVGALTGGINQQTLGAGAQRLLGAELTRSFLAPLSSALSQSLNIEEVSFSFNTQGQIVVEVRKFVSPTVALLYGSTTTQPITQYWGTSYYVRDYAALDFASTTAPSGFISYDIRVRVTFK